MTLTRKTCCAFPGRRASTLARAAACAMAIFIMASPGAAPAQGGESASLVPALRSEGGYLVDEHGRVTLLRGANVPAHCYKPFKFGEADLDALERFGFNFIRLGISWHKAEPREGEVDMDYIRDYVDFARKAGERGIYVMPEVHKYGWCQDGSDWPQWTCDHPVENSTDVAGMVRNARDFWGDDEQEGRLIGFWKTLVLEFRDLDNVMGYNPMNEPLDLWMFVPGVFDRNLMRFYDKWIREVRELDPDRIACLEPPTMNMVVPFRPPPFNHDNLVYAPHPYYVHGGDFIEPETRRGLVKKYRRISREAGRLGAALLVGEYGGDPETEFARRWLRTSWELQDRHFASASIWVYNNDGGGWSIVDNEREPKPFFAENLVRPYPRHTAGKPLELEYSPESGHFLYRYEPDLAIEAPTAIFLPPDLAGGIIEIKGGTGELGPSGRLLLVRAGAGSEEVLVRARPKE